MPYASRTQLSQLGIGGALLASISTTEQDAALVAASAEADDYLEAAGLTLPLLSWPGSLTQHVCAIAAYRLYSNRGYDPDAGDNKAIREQYKDAIAWLGQVKDGELSPAIVDSSAGDDGGGSPEVVTNPRRGW